jgi:hypothetical protein
VRNRPGRDAEADRNQPPEADDSSRVAGEEDKRPAQEPERDLAVAGRGLEGLVDELVGDGADQRPGAEGHDQT